jgi:cytochrome c-type biogenesis protein CcmF
MDIGSIFIWLSLFTVIGVLAGSFLFFITKKLQFKKIIFLSSLLTTLFITLAYLILTYYFLTSNFDIHYVWYNSSKSTEWYLKLTGVWAGQEGSLLIWVWLILIPLSLIEFKQIRAAKNNKKQTRSLNINESMENSYSLNVYDWTRIIVILVVLVFLILLLINDPFEPTHAQTFNKGESTEFTIHAEDYPAGHGMNPMLRNPWMVIHPPLLFIGYAFITIPFAAGLSYSITGDKNWTKISLQWSRLAWLFLTLGIGIGAVWAYLALGWGGYWAWDPVEVGSLIPWVTLSAFMHTQLMNKRKNQFNYLTPIFGTATFVLVIFATFITRSGMWVSVHAWSETEVGLILLSTMVVTIALAAVIIIRAFILNYNRNRRLGISAYDNLDEMDADTINMIATIVIFIIATIIIFYVLMITMGQVKPEEYEMRLTPVVLILMVVLSICLTWRYFGKENSIYFAAWGAIAGVASAVMVHYYDLFPGTPEKFYGENITNHDIVGFIVPFVVLTIIAAGYKMIKSINRRSVRTTLKSMSAHMIHLAIALIIMGYVASQTMDVEVRERVGQDESFKIGEYDVLLEKIEIEVDSGDLESREYWDTWFVDIEIYKNGDLIQKGKMSVIFSYNYDNMGRKIYTRIMTSEVYVGQMGTEDLYLSIVGINNNQIEITAKTIPLMSFLWTGLIIFIVGIIIRMITDSSPADKKRERLERLERRETAIGIEDRLKRRSPKDIKTRIKSKSDKTDYEKLLEDELKKLRG